MKKILKSVLVLACLVFFPMAAIAAPIAYNQFHFTIGGVDEDTPAGAFSYDNGNISGQNINVSKLTITNSGQSGIDYLTNNFTMSFSAFNDGNPDVWNWKNGTLTINDESGAKIFSGILNNLNLIKENYIYKLSIGTIENNTNFFISKFDDDKYDGYMNFLGTTTYTTTLDLAFVVPSKINQNMTTFSGDITGGNIHGQNPVPIPAAAWLFLSGFVGLAGLRRKNKK